jgi:hypothetical protein
MKVYVLLYHNQCPSDNDVFTNIVKICDSMETAKEEQKLTRTIFFNHDHYCPDLEWLEIKEFSVTTRFTGLNDDQAI